MELVIGEQCFFEQVPAQPCATAKIADLEAPAARKTDIDSDPGNIGRTSAKDDHRSVMVAKRALKRDHAIGINKRVFERQHSLQLGGIAADICAGKAKDCR